MRKYSVQKEIIRTTEADDTPYVVLTVPDAITGPELYRVLDRMRRDIPKQER